MRKIIIAKALLFNAEGKLLLIRRSNTAPRRPLEWDFPGGFVDKGDESFQVACLREVREETALIVEGDDLQLAFAESALIGFDSALSDVTWLYFSGEVGNPQDLKLSYEHDDARWVTPQEATQDIKYDRQLTALHYLVECNAAGKAC